mgnify:CR=1 FL=1
MLYLLRLIALGLYFLVASAINFVICFARPFNPDNSRLCGWMYSAPALRLLGLTVRLETAGMLAQPNPFVIVANHQSNWDLFVLGCAVPRRTVSLGKKSLKWIPFFGQIYWLAGNILIDRGNAFQRSRDGADFFRIKLACGLGRVAVPHHAQGLARAQRHAYQGAGLQRLRTLVGQHWPQRSMRGGVDKHAQPMGHGVDVRIGFTWGGLLM